MNLPTMYRDIIVDFINWGADNETISFSTKELDEIANYLDKLNTIKDIVEEYNSDQDTPETYIQKIKEVLKNK